MGSPDVAATLSSKVLGGALVVAGGVVATSSASALLGASVFGSLCFAALRPIFGACVAGPVRFVCARRRRARVVP